MKNKNNPFFKIISKSVEKFYDKNGFQENFKFIMKDKSLLNIDCNISNGTFGAFSEKGTDSENLIDYLIFIGYDNPKLLNLIFSIKKAFH